MCGRLDTPNLLDTISTTKSPPPSGSKGRGFKMSKTFRISHRRNVLDPLPTDLIHKAQPFDYLLGLAWAKT